MSRRTPSTAICISLVESKQKFIGQIMTSKSPVRSAEDMDETALSYAEIKALCDRQSPHQGKDGFGY